MNHDLLTPGLGVGGGLQAKYFDQVAAFVSFLKIRYAKRPCSEKVEL